MFLVDQALTSELQLADPIIDQYQTIWIIIFLVDFLNKSFRFLT